jgi:hypothetical protein
LIFGKQKKKRLDLPIIILPFSIYKNFFFFQIRIILDVECAPLNEESIAKKKIIMPNAIEWKSVDRVDMEGEEIWI